MLRALTALPAIRFSVRDSVALAFVATAAFTASQRDPTFLLWGVVVGSTVGIGWQRLFGAQWAGVSWTLGSAVAIPILCVPLHHVAEVEAYGPYGVVASSQWVWTMILPTLGALPLAHFIAYQGANRPASSRLFLAAALPASAAMVLAYLQGGPVVGSTSGLVYLLMGIVGLLPAIGRVVGEPLQDISQTHLTVDDRLTLLALGATPGAAMTILPGQPNPVIFAGWLIVLIVWRRFAVIPMLRVTARSRKERDLTVSAIEAERARIAADLHDDALQELTALVRRLDQAGDSEGAELARGVAERLRAICSDLRLPLLDDLGAGAALEWLVARIEPMAGGQVRLERVDSSRPPSGVELAVFRVAQEALANAVKHGKPPITVRYRVDESGHVSLSVDDQGTGIAPTAAESALAAGHLGLANMQQRAEQIGGLLDVRRWPTGGTHVALEWRPQ